jgi:hypothetical protein
LCWNRSVWNRSVCLAIALARAPVALRVVAADVLAAKFFLPLVPHGNHTVRDAIVNLVFDKAVNVGAGAKAVVRRGWGRGRDHARLRVASAQGSQRFARRAATCVRENNAAGPGLVATVAGLGASVPLVPRGKGAVLLHARLRRCLRVSSVNSGHTSANTVLKTVVADLNLRVAR